MTGDTDEFPSALVTNRFPQLRVITDPIARYIVDFLSSPPDGKYNDEERRQVAQEEFERAFASRTVSYLTLSAIILSTILFLDKYITSIPNQTYGLAIDLIGAIILGRGLLLSPMAIVGNSTSGFGGPMPVFRANQAIDAADGVWGIALLIIGIIIQGFAVIGFL